MKAVIQRVKMARVSVDGQEISGIGRGLLVYAGIGRQDTGAECALFVRKIIEMRLFPDAGKEGVFNVKDIGGCILLVSQFTLYGDVSKGRRPSFTGAMPADGARALYEKLLELFNSAGVTARGGVFQAMMEVESVNDGPYTIILDF